MRSAITAIFVLIFYAMSIPVSASAEKNDSIVSLINSTHSDTGRIHLYVKLAKANLSDSLEMTRKFADSAFELSVKTNYNKGKADALLYLGEYHYYSSSFEKAINSYRQAAEYYRSAGDSSSTSLLYYYTGYALSELSRYNEAAEYYLRSLHLDSLLNDTSGLANNHTSLGTTYEYLGKYKEAAESYLVSLNFFKALKDTSSISSCYINLGNVYSTWANYEKALDYYLKALRIEEKMNNASGLAIIYNNIGIIYHDWKEYDKALDYYMKGYLIEKKLNNKNGLAKSINNIAIIQEEKQNYDTALILYRKSLQIEEKLGNKFGIATSYGNLGEFYAKQNNPDEAISYYNKALQLFQDIDNPLGIGQIYNQLGSLRAQKGDYRQAIEYYHKSLQIVDTLNLVEMIRENYRDLSETYKKAANYPMAYFYLDKFQDLKDSIFNKEIRDKLTMMQYDFDLQKKQDEIELLNKEQDLQKLKILQQAKANKLLTSITIIISVALFVIIIIIMLLIKQYKQKARANAQLRNQRDELEKKQYDLQIAKEHAEESDRLKTAFLANLSHEVRTPMNGILGFADLLKEEDPGPVERRRYLDVITDNGHQLIHILNDLLDISLIETGQVKIKKKYVEVESMLRELIIMHTEINKKANDGKVDLICNMKSGSNKTHIYTDHFRLKQILNNLISNAIKYTERGYVRISYHIKNAEIEFTVEDTGIGISEQHIQMIFDRFRQVDDSNTRKKGGTGLGLTISKKLIELLGGSIFVESEVGKGSRFIVSFPHQEIKTDLPDLKTPAQKNNARLSEKSHLLPDLSTKSILVAEDDEASFNLLSMILRSTNCNILHAKNGIECVEAYSRFKDLHFKNIDMVIMDLQMPEMDGMEAARQIKALSPESHIIALSAYSHLKAGDPEIDGIFMDYLMKPVSPKELLSVISSLLKPN